MNVRYLFGFPLLVDCCLFVLRCLVLFLLVLHRIVPPAAQNCDDNAQTIGCSHFVAENRNWNENDKDDFEVASDSERERRRVFDRKEDGEVERKRNNAADNQQPNQISSHNLIPLSHQSRVLKHVEGRQKQNGCDRTQIVNQIDWIHFESTTIGEEKKTAK